MECREDEMLVDLKPYMDDDTIGGKMQSQFVKYC